MTTWPALLPEFHVQLQESTQDNVIRTDFDAGFAQVRKRFSAVPTTFQGTMILDRAQYTALQTFYDVTLNAGTKTFQKHDPSIGGLATFRFRARPSYTHITAENSSTRLYRVQIQIERRP